MNILGYYYDHLLSQVDPNIPKENYSILIDVEGDGFCGWRALAVQIYDDEHQFWTVKKKMRDTLFKNEKFYMDNFKDYFDFDEVKKRVCYGIEETVGSDVVRDELFVKDGDAEDEVKYFCNPEYYFSSVGCPQLAADTFFGPITLYSEKEYQNTRGVSYIPLLTEYTDVDIKKKRPQPLLLQRVNQNHWVTLGLRRSKKLPCPLPDHSYEFATKDLKKVANIKKTVWNYYLVFAQQLPKDSGMFVLILQS